VLYIEREDFAEAPPPQYRRLAPGREVRLRYSYIIKCESLVKDPKTGEVIEVHCTYDPGTRTEDKGKKGLGTVHWVSETHAIPITVRLYDRLFSVPDPMAHKEDFTFYLNPQSLVVMDQAWGEPSLSKASPGSTFQFERLGYFYLDPLDTAPGQLVFNRSVTLKDTWGKLKREKGG